MARRKRRRAHQQGCVYQRGPANFWIKWRENGRVRYRGGYTDRDLAEKVLNTIGANIRKGEVSIKPEAGDAPALSDLAKDWLQRREVTHRAWRDDRNRWNKHLEPFFGPMKPGHVTPATIREFVEGRLVAGLSSTSAGHCVRLLSTFFADLVERGLAPTNPVSALPRSTRRLYRNAHDPNTTGFLEKLGDVARVYTALHAESPTVATAFAVGALGGLRTGEVLALTWQDVDLDKGLIVVRQQVRHGKLGPLKDDDSRLVPIQNDLRPTLTAWKLATGGAGLLFRPANPKKGGRPGRPATYIRAATLHAALAKVLPTLNLPTLTWYQVTRHTFASLWVLHGGSIEKLSKVMGHSSITTTERYAHLRPGLFAATDRGLLAVNLTPAGQVIPLRPENGATGYAVVTRDEESAPPSKLTA